MTLEQLPGIVELVEQNWKAESCRSFEDLVVAYVCFEGNPFEKLKESKLARAAVVSAAASATDCEQLLFEEEEACSVSTSNWDGTRGVPSVERVARAAADAERSRRDETRNLQQTSTGRRRDQAALSSSTSTLRREEKGFRPRTMQ